MSTNKIPEYILNDLFIRFLYCTPRAEENSIIRIMNRLERAHWFYLDNYCKNNITLIEVKFTEFIREFFNTHKICLNPDEVIRMYENYKLKIPTYGTIIIGNGWNKVLLAQNYYSNMWSFSKGKINESETPIKCAIRETLEEVGIDVSTYIQKDIKFEMKHRYGRKTTLFLCTNIPLNTVFRTKTIREINSIRWFDLSDLIRNPGSVFHLDSIHRNQTYQTIKKVYEYKSLKKPISDLSISNTLSSSLQHYSNRTHNLITNTVVTLSSNVFSSASPKEENIPPENNDSINYSNFCEFFSSWKCGILFKFV